jgi:hypothetical protein
MQNSPGSYKGIPIRAGTDAEIQAQIRAIDAGQTSVSQDDILKLAQQNPVIKAFLDQGNTLDSLMNAVTTGNFTNVKSAYGQPFTLEEQQKAMAQAETDTKAYYDALQQKETQDTEAQLKQSQLDYQNYLATQATNFQKDKTTLDQTAANQGVLFSGGRAQKEQNLQNTYAQDQAYKQASVGGDIGNVARDYQYKYGNDAAGGLSQYYNLGSQGYNPRVATGGVTPGGLSSVYSTGASNFAGTRRAEKEKSKVDIATGLLKNKGNKLLGTSYLNQIS